MTDTGEFGERMNGMPKYVASTTLETLEWNNSRLLTGDVADAVGELKQQPGKDILLAGSAALLQTLLARDLIDELCLMVHPVILGQGKRLFRDGLDRKVLQLAETTAFSAGVVVLTYRPAEPNQKADRRVVGRQHRYGPMSMSIDEPEPRRWG